jgi:hypothetical protein
LGGLERVKLGVLACHFHQLVVAALLDDPAVARDVDAVRMPDAGQPVRDQQHADTTYSTPALAVIGNDVDIAVVGPGDSLDFYWALDGSPTWHAETITGTGGIGGPLP